MKAFRAWTKPTQLTKNFVVHARNAWLTYFGTTLFICIRLSAIDDLGYGATAPCGYPSP